MDTLLDWSRRSLLAASVLLGACSGATGEGAAGDGDTSEEDIVGGRVENRFPPVGYLALDEDASGARFTPFCTATLIAPRVVATAAHCVHDTKHSAGLHGPYITFAFGRAIADRRAPVYVSAIYEDPAYDPQRPDYFSAAVFEHDFALLVLERPITEVAPARLEAADPTRPFIAVGYGRTKTGPYDLVEEGLPKRKSLAMKLVGGTAASHYELQSTAGAVCYGDSGGPLLQTVQINGRAETVTVGVLATMFAEDPNVTCARGTVAAYVSFVAQRAFVSRVLASVR